MALASLELRLAENALDQSDLMAQKYLEPDWTGQNRSNPGGLASAAVMTLVVVISHGFVEAEKRYSADCFVDL